MATLTITVGALTSTVNANNTKAAQILTLFVQEMNGPVNGTDQEKLDFVRDRIVAYLNDAARNRQRTNRALEAQATADSEVTSIGWT